MRSRIQTQILEIAFEESGATYAKPILLLHGWPDSPRGWNELSLRLEAEGLRAIAPYLRGSNPTRFLSADTPRDGSGVALAADVIEFADALGLDRFAVVGHDWGARAAYILAALFPDRVMAIATLALGYQPRGIFRIPSFEQSRRFWYQWFMCTDAGATAVKTDPIGFARLQWQTWSPAGWFDDAEFEKTADSFSSPDWSAITLNAYRSRWLNGEASDSRYDSLRFRLKEVEKLATPTLMIQGMSDYCDAPEESEGLDGFFTNGYRRKTLKDIGHFPHREAPGAVAEAVLDHFQNNWKA